MTGGVMDYLDACAGVTDADWLGLIDTAPEGANRIEFWTVAQIIPWEIRQAGDDFARRWVTGERPATSLECWFRRVACRMVARKREAVEPWVILYAMTHALAGHKASAPVAFATTACLPIESEYYAHVVSISRDEMPESKNWPARCNR